MPVVRAHTELTGCLSVAIAVMRHQQKQFGEERFWFTTQTQQFIPGSQGMNLESRADAEAMEDSCLLFVVAAVSF